MTDQKRRKFLRWMQSAFALVAAALLFKAHAEGADPATRHLDAPPDVKVSNL